MNTKNLNYKDLDELVAILNAGGIIAFPTETVFGFGIVYDNAKSFELLVNIKKRHPNKPFTLMCANFEDIDNLALVTEKARAVIEHFMPGPITIVLPILKEVPHWVDLGTKKVGFRISSFQFIRELIIKLGKPLLVPSANVEGEEPSRDSAEVFEKFNGQLDAIVCGTSGHTLASTIIEFNEQDEYKILRKGPISLQEIEKVIRHE